MHLDRQHVAAAHDRITHGSQQLQGGLSAGGVVGRQLVRLVAVDRGHRRGDHRHDVAPLARYLRGRRQVHIALEERQLQPAHSRRRGQALDDGSGQQ